MKAGGPHLDGAATSADGGGFNGCCDLAEPGALWHVAVTLHREQQGLPDYTLSEWYAAARATENHLQYELTTSRHPLLSFSCTLLVTEASGGCIGSSLLSVARSRPVGRAV